eukprot:Amastigsp_a510548_37.p2 type:complete len:152 gc:universal Amastigsp_a510548_37:132-587(+)
MTGGETSRCGASFERLRWQRSVAKARFVIVLCCPSLTLSSRTKSEKATTLCARVDSRALRPSTCRSNVALRIFNFLFPRKRDSCRRSTGLGSVGTASSARWLCSLRRRATTGFFAGGRCSRSRCWPPALRPLFWRTRSTGPASRARSSARR